MNGKYIIILLFIFLVFLMGSINSTITNNFYNNTTGSQDHYNLINLSFDDSGHTGFQSSDTLDSDVSALGYVTNATMASDDLKVNKSGDNMTGKLIMSGNFTTRASLMDGNGIFLAYNDSIMRTQLSGNGIQEWKLFAAGQEAGYILYTAPGSPSSVGIIFRNASQGKRTQIWLAPTGLELYSSSDSGGNSNVTRILNQDGGSSVQITALAGTGNRPLCADSNGIIIICP